MIRVGLRRPRARAIGDISALEDEDVSGDAEAQFGSPAGERGGEFKGRAAGPALSRAKGPGPGPCTSIP
jgi:hypothetical protein